MNLLWRLLESEDHRDFHECSELVTKGNVRTLGMLGLAGVCFHACRLADEDKG